jgi:hypothetical protein
MGALILFICLLCVVIGFAIGFEVNEKINADYIKAIDKIHKEYHEKQNAYADFLRKELYEAWGIKK